MSRFIVLASVLAALTAAGATTAFKLTHRLALAAEPIDPAILHTHRQQWRDEMPLP
jgi:hypothetical protein